MLAICPVGPAKVAPLAQADAHGRDVTWRDDIHERVGMFIFPVDHSLRAQVPVPIAIERQHVRDAGFLDARNGLHAREHFLEDGAPSGPLLSPVRCAVVVFHMDRRGTVGLKSQIDVEHAQETAQQQPRADQQHTGQCDFRNNQDALQPRSSGT